MNTIQVGEVGTPDGNLAYDERPDWFKKWEATGLLHFEDKNGDGRIQYYNDENDDFTAKAESYGWKGNELLHIPFGKTVDAAKSGPDRDIMVLANPEIAGLPNWVIALVVAGGLAAALSTAAGLLMAIASAISHDLLKGTFTPQITEKQELLASRIAMAGAIVVAGYLGLNPPGFAAGTVAIAFGLAASSIFPALMMGIFSKRINNQAAIWGMLSGLGVTLLYVFQHKGIMFIPGTAFLGEMEPSWFLGISPNAFGAVGALVNFVVAFIVGRVTEAPPEHIQHLVEDIRIPKGADAAVDH
jgi:cation/acetate symporter